MDRKYWEKYYSKHGNDDGINHQSSFSEFCLEKFFYDRKLTIIELGSGNGRDSIYFASHNHKIIAVDQSSAAVDVMRLNIQDNRNYDLHVVTQDFLKYDFSSHDPIDVFYSRFTLHAINKHEEDILLPRIHNHLRAGGLFCVEARTTKDPLYGVGKDCGDNAFRTDHYRRFIDPTIFLKTMLSLGCDLLFFIEENDLSVYNDDNPVLLRAIFQKR